METTHDYTHLDAAGNPARVHYYTWSAEYIDDGRTAVLSRGESFPTADVGKATRMIADKFHPDVRDNLRIAVRHSTASCGACNDNL